MSKSKGKVLVAAPVHKLLIDGLQSIGYSVELAPDINQHKAPNLLADCVGLITSTRLQVDSTLLSIATQLKWIGRMGSGMEVIDVPFAESLGIACFGSPEGNSNAVGEHAVGLLLNLIRHISVSYGQMKEGIWLRDENRGIELEGKTIGIIGYGHTGRAFARKLMGFDMQILAYDKYHAVPPDSHVAACHTLEEIYRSADIISFHVPLQPDTIYYFDDAFLQAMQKPFLLINTSRGPVIETNALYNGVMSGRILGACLDVFETEPIKAMNPDMKQKMDQLIHLPQVITTPHIAGYTYEALYKMSDTLMKKIISGGF